MKKFLRRLLGWGLALCLICIAALFLLSSKASSFAAKNLSEKLKVLVTVGDISFSLNSLTVKNLDIANLPNSRLPKALSVKTICSKNNLLNYLDKVITIEQLTLDDIYLGLEFDSAKGTNGNWTVLMNNLDAASSSSSKEEKKTVMIKELVLTNIQVDVVYKSSDGKIKRLPPIPKIVLHNINSSEGLPTDQIMKSVLGQMLKSVFTQENVKNMFDGLIDQPKNAVDTIMQPFKGLF